MFVPIGTTDGSDYHAKMRDVQIPAAEGGNVFLGDMMTLAGSASADGLQEQVLLATVGDAPSSQYNPTLATTPENLIQAVASTNLLAGAIVEIFPDFLDEGSLIRNYHAGGADQGARLVYGEKVIYEAPANQALAVTDSGANKNLDLGAGGNQQSGIGSHGIGGDPTEPALGQLRIIGASRSRVDQFNGRAITDVGAIWRCTINSSVDQYQRVGA